MSTTHAGAGPLPRSYVIGAMLLVLLAVGALVHNARAPLQCQVRRAQRELAEVRANATAAAATAAARCNARLSHDVESERTQCDTRLFETRTRCAGDARRERAKLLAERVEWQHAAFRANVALARHRETLRVFVHVPKAGGTTFSTMLSNENNRRIAAHEGGMLWTVEEQDFLALTEAEQDAQWFITGHRGVGVHTLPRPFFKVPGRAVLYFTMLRHPFARIVSQWRFGRERDEYFRVRHVAPADVTLRAYWEFKKQRYRWRVEHNGTPNNPWSMVGNPMVFQLAHYHNVHYWRGDADTPTSPPVDPTEKRPMTRADLELAKRNLAHMVVVGVLERADDSYELMRWAFGWPRPDDWTPPKTNVAAEAHANDPERSFRAQCGDDAALFKEIKDDAALDLELYAYAVELFEQQWRWHLDDAWAQPTPRPTRHPTPLPSPRALPTSAGVSRAPITSPRTSVVKSSTAASTSPTTPTTSTPTPSTTTPTPSTTTTTTTSAPTPWPTPTRESDRA